MKRLSVLLLAVIAFACKKEEASVLRPAPVKPDQLLKIQLAPQYIGGQDVDSAKITWSRNGQLKTVPLYKKNDTLSARLDAFVEGEGVMTITLFTKKEMNSHPLQFERVVPLNLNRKQEIRVTGPGSISQPEWMPRVVMAFSGWENFTVKAIVGLRVQDPYFELKNIHPEWSKRISVERIYSLGATTIASGIWDCQTGVCTDDHGNYVNRSFFKFLPSQAGNKAWDHAEIIARFYNAEGDAGELNFNYSL